MTPALPLAGNPVSSTFSWTPTLADIGTHEITFTLTDDGGLSTTCTLTIDVEFDRDGDGLLDVWELDGYTAPNGVFVDLPALGANVNHKDVFVSVKFMQNAPSRTRPSTIPTASPESRCICW